MSVYDHESGRSFVDIWDALFFDPVEAEKMRKWSNERMNTVNIEKTLETINMYFKNVWHHVNCADVEPVLTELFEELYGTDVWEQLDKLAISKENGQDFDPPKLLTGQIDIDTIREVEIDVDKVFEVNPEGNPPEHSCKWCITDKKIDWRGIDTRYLKQTCGFCKDDGNGEW